MNKFILITAFFTLLVATEILTTALSVEIFGICMMDSAADGETEKDSKEKSEKSEKDKKVEILIDSSSEKDNTFHRSLICMEKPNFSRPYLDQSTPPPEA